jgi:hypothetical protein
LHLEHTFGSSSFCRGSSFQSPRLMSAPEPGVAGRSGEVEDVAGLLD